MSRLPRWVRGRGRFGGRGRGRGRSRIRGTGWFRVGVRAPTLSRLPRWVDVVYVTSFAPG